MSTYQITEQTEGATIAPTGAAVEGAPVSLAAGELVTVNDAQDVLTLLAQGGDVAVTRADGTKVSVPAANLEPYDAPTSHLPYIVGGAALLVAFLYWNTNR